MGRDGFLLALALLGVMNGLFSPFLGLLIALLPGWFPGFLPLSAPVVFYTASLLLSTLMIMLAGIPAALFERVTKKKETDTASLTVWVASMIFLSIPTFLVMAAS